MVSRNKMSKTSKRHHWGRDGKNLKYQGRCKGTAIFTSSERKILKELLYQYVPKEMMERPKKGFSVPVSLWLKDGDMRLWAETVLTEACIKMGEFLDMNIVKFMWENYLKKDKWTETIWYLLVLGQWLLNEEGK